MARRYRVNIVVPEATRVRVYQYRRDPADKQLLKTLTGSGYQGRDGVDGSVQTLAKMDNGRDASAPAHLIVSAEWKRGGTGHFVTHVGSVDPAAPTGYAARRTFVRTVPAVPVAVSGHDPRAAHAAAEAAAAAAVDAATVLSALGVRDVATTDAVVGTALEDGAVRATLGTFATPRAVPPVVPPPDDPFVVIPPVIPPVVVLDDPFVVIADEPVVVADKGGSGSVNDLMRPVDPGRPRLTRTKRVALLAAGGVALVGGLVLGSRAARGGRAARRSYNRRSRR